MSRSLAVNSTFVKLEKLSYKTITNQYLYPKRPAAPRPTGYPLGIGFDRSKQYHPEGLPGNRGSQETREPDRNLSLQPGGRLQLPVGAPFHHRQPHRVQSHSKIGRASC